MKNVYVIGAGLAGSEAAYQIAKAGIHVTLFEMKPEQYSPAHSSPDFAELVCSNSLRSNQLENAVGLLKEELRLNDSFLISAADKHKVPAGGALAVDRNKFSSYITDELEKHPLIKSVRKEIKSLSEFDLEKDYVLVATGPLTSDSLFADLQNLLGHDDLYFFDAVAPIIEAESINQSKVFKASRYDKGDGVYINCPFTKAEYEMFYQELVKAKTAKLNTFDDIKYFQGCMPVEAIAKQGKETLLFGPLKPVGLTNPKSGEQPYAVVQLRQDNQAATLYNMVGFQTQLTWGEQKRIFRLIPGLENAIFERLGVMHRNSFIKSPIHLKLGYQHKEIDHLFFAGQITGVEGYVESIGSGFVAAKHLINQINNVPNKKTPKYFEKETILGGLAHYIASAEAKYFQPMNANYGLVPELNKQERIQLKAEYDIKEKGRRGRRLAYSYRALSHYKTCLKEDELNVKK